MSECSEMQIAPKKTACSIRIGNVDHSSNLVPRAECQVNRAMAKYSPVGERHTDQLDRLAIKEQELPGGKHLDCLVIRDKEFPGLKRFVPVLKPARQNLLYSKRLNTEDCKHSISSFSTMVVDQLSTIDETFEEDDQGSEHGSLTPQVSPESANIGELRFFKFHCDEDFSVIHLS